MNFKSLIFCISYIKLLDKHLTNCEKKNTCICDSFGYERELYFCITVESKNDYVIEDANLTSGKWVKNRYSKVEIESPLNKTITSKKPLTICAKQRKKYKYGPAGRLTISNEANATMYVWWDILNLEDQHFNIDFPSSKENKRELDKNWIKVFLY